MLTSAFGAVAVVLASCAAPATADAGCFWDDIPDASDAQRTQCATIAPATTVPTTTQSGGLSSWVSDHAARTLLGVVLIGVAVAIVIAGRRLARADAAAEAAVSERGRAIASAAHADAVAQAERDALAAMPPRDAWDPMGMGVAPPQVDVAMPEPPPQSPEDLARYSVFNAAVPWVPGSAFAAVVARNGDWSRARDAWSKACEQVGLGETNEAGVFTPAAAVEGVRTIGGDTDGVVLAVRPAGLHVTEKQLDRVLPTLVVTAFVETAESFQREAASGLYLTTLRNVFSEPAAAPEPSAPADSDPSAWEW